MSIHDYAHLKEKVEKLLTSNDAHLKAIYSNNEKLRREVLYVIDQVPVATNIGDDHFSNGHIGGINMSRVTQVAEEAAEPPRVLNRPFVRNKHHSETRMDSDTTGLREITVGHEEDSEYLENRMIVRSIVPNIVEALGMKSH